MMLFSVPWYTNHGPLVQTGNQATPSVFVPHLSTTRGLMHMYILFRTNF